jgi:hypothetical protein
MVCNVRHRTLFTDTLGEGVECEKMRGGGSGFAHAFSRFVLGVLFFKMQPSLIHMSTWAVSFRVFYKGRLVVKSLIYIKNHLRYINLVLRVNPSFRPGERFIHHKF